jgi:hypothetical protein
LIVLVLAADGLAMAGCSGCNSTKPEATKSDHPALHQTTDMLCPYSPPSTKGTRPQGASYEGACLSAGNFFTSKQVVGKVTGGDAPLKTVTMYYEKGKPDATQDFNVVYKDGDYNKITNVKYLLLYKVFYGDPTVEKNNMCNGQPYAATEAEKKAFCGGSSSCPDLDNLTGKALIIPGWWDRTTGQWSPTADLGDGKQTDVFSLSCVSGVEAKCVMWGYTPWVADLQPYYLACVNAARAHYLRSDATHPGPDKDSFTCQDTEIDVYDNYNDAGLQKRDSSNTTMVFESLWRKDGSLYCAARARWGHCDTELRGVVGSVKPCDDPEPDVGGTWKQGTLPSDVILAVASETNHDLGYCPNFSPAEHPELVCRPK